MEGKVGALKWVNLRHFGGLEVDMYEDDGSAFDIPREASEAIGSILSLHVDKHQTVYYCEIDFG